MFRRIMVPLDGSKFADVALPVAAHLARLAQAELELVLVHELLPSGSSRVDAGSVPDDGRPRRDREAAYLYEAAGRVRELVGGRVSTRLLEGEAGPSLEQEIGSWHPDLVIMATHGRGPLGRMWLGSVADHLVRHGSAPLLLLRPRDEVDWPPADLHLDSILVALDLSDYGEAVLQPVADLAALSGAWIDLVHVVDAMAEGTAGALPVTTGNRIEAEREEAERGLKAVAARLRNRGVMAGTRVMVGVGVAGPLIEDANQSKHDLIALTTHGRGGLRRALIGSVAEQVIRGSNKPVLVVRPGITGAARAESDAGELAPRPQIGSEAASYWR